MILRCCELLQRIPASEPTRVAVHDQTRRQAILPTRWARAAQSIPGSSERAHGAFEGWATRAESEILVSQTGDRLASKIIGKLHLYQKARNHVQGQGNGNISM